MFFVSIHFKDNLVCWFVWHYTPVSATSGMDIYANTFRVRSAAAQEKGKWKAGFWGGVAIGRWTAKPNIFSILVQVLVDFYWKTSSTSVLLVLCHLGCFQGEEKWGHFATIGSQARHCGRLDRSIFCIPPHTQDCPVHIYQCIAMNQTICDLHEKNIPNSKVCL